MIAYQVFYLASSIMVFNRDEGNEIYRELKRDGYNPRGVVREIEGPRGIDDREETN